MTYVLVSLTWALAFAVWAVATTRLIRELNERIDRYATAALRSGSRPAAAAEIRRKPPEFDDTERKRRILLNRPPIGL